MEQIFKDRLLTVANFLDTVEDTSFNMGLYRYKSTCGTVACALGWAPIALGEDNQRAYDVGTCKPFHAFGIERLGISPYFKEGGNWHPNWNWCFLFSATWHVVNNTAKAAANRIRYFVQQDGNVPTDTWSYSPEWGNPVDKLIPEVQLEHVVEIEEEAMVLI
jgi:hypothetical protein